MNRYPLDAAMLFLLAIFGHQIGWDTAWPGLVLLAWIACRTWRVATLLRDRREPA